MPVSEQAIMQLIEHYGKTLSDQHVLCTKEDFLYISDPQTYELLHMNVDQMEETPEHWHDYHGRKCYDVLQGRDTPCPFCTNSLLRDDRFHIWTFRNPITNHKYLLKDILVDWKGKPARMEVVIDVNDPARMESMLFESAESRSVVLDCANYLWQPGALSQSLQKTIERISVFFKAQSGCIQIIDSDAPIVSYCEANTEIQPLHVPASVIKSVENMQEPPRLIYLQDISTADLDPSVKDLFHGRGIERLILAPMYQQKKALGFIALYNPQEHLSLLSDASIYSIWVAKAVTNDYLKNSLTHLQDYDSSLSCLNLVGLRKRASALLSSHEPPYALLSCDIRYFKTVNDCFGFAAGDQLLAYFCDCISPLLGPQDVFGRYGSNTFCILRAYRGAAELSAFFELLVEHLRRYPTRHADFEYELAAGAFVFPDNTLSVNTAMDNAQLALRCAKDQPGNSLFFYSEQLGQKQARRQLIAMRLKKALEQQEIEVYLQPQYRYSSGEIVGAEVLARWHDAELGWVTPDEFIPQLEQSGQIYALDRYVWEKACKLLKTYKGSHPLPISVNVSRSDILQEDVCGFLLSLIEKYGLSPADLRLEITETAYVNLPSQLIGVVRELQGHGFSVEMDDFGKGDSSLNVLGDVPVDLLKLDMRFLDEEGNSERRGNILSSVIRMARWMEIPVIAEGVETFEQAEFLKTIGCDLMQGYYFARPMPASAFETLLLASGVSQRPIHPAVRETLDAAAFLDPKSKTSILFECMGAAAVVECVNGQLDGLMINDSFFELFGVNRETFSPYVKSMEQPLNPESRDALLSAIQTAVEKGEYTYECYLQADAILFVPRWVSISLRLISTFDSHHLLLMQLRDITEQKDNMNQLMRHQELFRILSDIPGTMSFEYESLNDVMHFHYNSPQHGMQEFHGEEYLSSYIQHSSIIPPESAGPVAELLKNASLQPASGTLDCRLTVVPNLPRLCRIHYLSLANDLGKVYRVIGRVEDREDEMREQKEKEESLRLQSMKDSATDLWNRNAMEEHVSRLLSRHTGGTLLMLDVDDFKLINDRYGHLAGDGVLRGFAQMLQYQFDSVAEIGRMGGDEFAVYWPSVLEPEQLVSLSERVFSGIPSFVKLDVAGLGASIGAAVCRPDEPCTFCELYRRADYALYAAKRGGKRQMIQYSHLPADTASHPVPDAELRSYAQPGARDMTADVFRMLYRSRENATAIRDALERIGSWLGVSRMFIWQSGPFGGLRLIHDWRDAQTAPYAAPAQALSPSATQELFDTLDTQGVFLHSGSPEGLPSCQRALLLDRPMRNLLQFGMYRDGQWVGLIGFEQSRDDAPWSADRPDTMLRIAEILTAFILCMGRHE